MLKVYLNKVHLSFTMISRKTKNDVEHKAKVHVK